ncbi:MAG: hypothetical protein XD95_0276 [Microgenomates bacterium 39_7]|nr:MAG: hypothetical protein XD95_0276 [Microgenomates bacterium 39_7]
MKKNAIFLLVLAALLVTALGALYYQYQQGELSYETEEVIEEPTTSETVPFFEESDQMAGESDDELDSIPPLSIDDSLETIQQELEETVILEEDLSDL